MAQTPNFDVKNQFPAGELISGLQRKAEIENQQRIAEYNQKIQMVQTVVDGASKTVSGMVEYSKQRQRRDFINTLADSLSSNLMPNLNPGKSSLFPGQDLQTASYDPSGNAGMAAAVQINPEPFIKQMAESQYNTPKTTQLQTKTVNVTDMDGTTTPTEAVFDPSRNRWLEANTNQPITGKISPYSPTTDTNLSDADRKRLTPLAKAVIEGRATPSAVTSARGGDRQKLSLVTAELDPNFDLSLAPQRIATRKDFSSAGKSGQSLSSLNTALGHLDRMYENGQALDNTDLQLWNKYKNLAFKQTGNAKVDRLLADRDAVTSELGRVFQTTGVVTQEERNEFRARLSEASSPEQIKSVADEWINLLKSRTDTFKSNWDQTMSGVETPVPIINKKTKAILIKHGFDPVTLEKSEKASDTPSASIPAGLQATIDSLKAQGHKVISIKKVR